MSRLPGNSTVLRTLLVTVSLTALVAIVFRGVGGHEFINYDDNRYVTDNPSVLRGLTGAGVRWAFTAVHADNWHPLTWLSHMLDVELYGTDAGAHHLVSAALHALNAVLLFLVLRGMSGALWQSAAAAALFAVHPLHVESVAWVAERKDVLSTVFWLLTMAAYLWYVRRPGPARLVPAVVLCALGLLSKPMVVTLPFVLLLADYWPLNRWGRIPGRALVLEKVPLFLLAAFSGTVTFVVQQQGGSMKSMELYPLSARVANALVSCLTYAGKMLWPGDLAIFYPHPGTGVNRLQAAVAMLAVATVTLLAVRRARQLPFLATGWFWYLGTLVPVIGLVQVGAQSMADRYTYVPLIGLSVMAVWGLPELLGRVRHRRVMLAAVTAVVLSVLVLMARLQVGYWRNSLTLFSHALAVTPDNYLAHNNLGTALSRRGRWDEAMRHFRESQRINPEYTEASLNVRQLRRFLLYERIEKYRAMLKEAPDSESVRLDLGIALLEAGSAEEARAHFRAVLRIRPDHARAYMHLGDIDFRQGRIEEAIRLYREALSLEPGLVRARDSLERALARSGRAGPLHPRTRP